MGYRKKIEEFFRFRRLESKREAREFFAFREAEERGSVMKDRNRKFWHVAGQPMPYALIVRIREGDTMAAAVRDYVREMFGFPHRGEGIESVAVPEFLDVLVMPFDRETGQPDEQKKETFRVYIRRAFHFHLDRIVRGPDKEVISISIGEDSPQSFNTIDHLHRETEPRGGSNG